ncbi:hypothetical protein ABT317_27820, partial [Streptomyces carpinensis]
ARTEAGRAWNTATLAAARDVTGPDAPIVKQWISQRDSRVRHDHKEANGQIRLLDEQFTVGEARMDFPHDPTAPADQVINCRCVLSVYPETRASTYGSQAAPPSGLSDPRLTAAGAHTGAMIALIPSDEDLARLAIDGGEPADEMHLTIWYLGEADVFPEHERASLIDLIREELADRGLGPVSARIFGVNRWNGNSDEPCWVYAVSDDTSDDRPPASPYLHEVRNVAAYGLRNSELDDEQVPDQHSPWVAHVTATYGDADLAELEDRLGPITFDRLRIAFAGQYTDIPLGSQQQEEEAMPEQQTAADQAVAEPITTRAWSTPGDTAIAFENEETGDGRVFAPGSLYWETDPMPLQYADEMNGGHDGAELCGAINTAARDGNRITASGVLYLNRYAGMDAATLLEDGAPLGVSADLDDVDVEFVDKTLDPEEDGWLFASAHLAHASVLTLEDGSVMLSGSARAEWVASTGGDMTRHGFDLQLVTGPGGTVSAATIRAAFEGSGVLTAAAGDPDDPESGIVVHEEKAGDFLVRITRARLRGATLVAMPAYNRARIVLDPLEETASSSAPVILAASDDVHERVVTYVCTSPTAVGARDVANALGIRMHTARHHLNRAARSGRIFRIAPGQFVPASTLPEGVHDDEETSAAASAPTEPLDLPSEIEASAWRAIQQMPPMPAEWFREPTVEELPDGSGGVHYKDGRVFGFVATMDEPHAGYPGKNLTVRKLAAQGLDFTHFLRAKRQLDDGTTVRVGAMTMNVGHHRDGAECETASCQFDDTRTVGAIITSGLSERGIWFSGAAAPWLSEWDRAVFQACQPSYHLKQGRDGKWQLRAVLTVPVPGHSTPLVAAIHAVAERSQLALAASAAGLLPAPDTLPGQDQDTDPAVSASSTDTATDQPGQRPDTVSGQSVVDATALAAALLTDSFVDRLIDAMALREAERRAEIEALQASLAITPAEITAAATPKEND